MDIFATCLIILTVVLQEVVPCRFPEFVQSRPDDVIKREWHTHVMEDGRESRIKFELVVSFHGNRMRATVVTSEEDEKSKPQSFTRQCLLGIGDKYLASHKADRKTDQVYLCMYFIKRSGNVFQVKNSKFSKYQDPTLCSEEKMFLNDWPFVDRGNLYKSYQPCPLDGGYSVNLFDKREGRGVCDAFHGETRIESECMKGEGMYFRFRHKNCVPPGMKMSKQQRTFCIATWQDDKFTFTILRHDRTENVWCMRYPIKMSSAFTAYLFRDLFCDRNDFPQTDQYIAMDLTKEPPRSLAQLCIDDYEACDFWSQPCRHASSVMQLTCAKRCGICSSAYPTVCTLPTGLRGNWEENNRNGKEVVEISDMGLSKEKHADFRCVQWHYSPFDPDIAFMEQMFVTTFDNGCRPRYSCAQFKKHTPSVMRYKQSMSQIWPFEDANALAVDCSSTFKYKDDSEPFGDTYQSRHFKVLISMSERVYVDCRLDKARPFDVTFQGGSQCPGVLTQEGLSSKTKMKLVLDGCPGMSSDMVFGCLDSTRHGYISNQLIVSESIEDPTQIRCWMFPSYPEHTFYLLPLSHCNEGANEKITSGQFTPLATFKEEPPTTTTTTTTTNMGPSSLVLDGIVQLDKHNYQKSIDSDDWTVENEYDAGGKNYSDGVRKEYSVDYAESRSGKLKEPYNQGVSLYMADVSQYRTMAVCILTAMLTLCLELR